MITAEEKQKILRGISLMNSSTNDCGQLVPRLMRMCGFMTFNIPITCGMMLAPPTIAQTVFWQWINQSYNAGLNFGNKNSSCTFTSQDLITGYLAASAASVGVGVSLRKLTSGMTKSASGNKLLVLNFLVAASASGSANFCNTMIMRYPETKKGITVYRDKELTEDVGVSKECAKTAVKETALSRVCMSYMCIGIPTFSIMLVRALGYMPQSRGPKFAAELSCITVGILLGLPFSLSIFPPTSSMAGK